LLQQIKKTLKKDDILPHFIENNNVRRNGGLA